MGNSSMIASGIGCVEELSFIAQGEQLVVLFCRVAALFNKAINSDILKHAFAALQHTLKCRLSRR